MILARRSDLALDKDDQGRFLPWLIAFMVFLAILATAGVMVLTALVHRWDRGVSGTLTVQIAPAETAAADRQRKRAALLLLRGAEGVIAGLKSGATVIDFGTSLPGSTRALAEEVAARRRIARLMLAHIVV